MCTNVRMRTRPWMRLCAFTDAFSSACLCCAACAYYGFPLLSLANGGRWEGRGEEPAVTRVPRTSSASQNLTCARCQHQATATKAYNWASVLANLHVELWFYLSLLGNWQAYQFMCIISIPTLREVIMVKIVHIIIEFLRHIMYVYNFQNYLFHYYVSINVCLTTSYHIYYYIY